MKIDKFEIERHFHIGEEIFSGGRRSKFELLEFTDVSIQIKPTTKEGRTRLMYNRLALVVKHFNEVNPKRIEKSVYEILDENGTRDTQNESYLYGFAREYLSRTQEGLANLDNIFQISVEKSRRDTTEQRNARLKKAVKKPKRIPTTVYVFERNPDVVAEVLDRADGFCEAPDCGNRAPFVRKSNGSPYLEVHHRVPLAEDGDDTVENAIALCPNCHRKAHYGQP